MNDAAEIAEEVVVLDQGTRPPLKRSRSMSWKYFDKLDDQLASCSICKIRVKHSGNTSNLFNVRRSRPSKGLGA